MLDELGMQCKRRALANSIANGAETTMLNELSMQCTICSHLDYTNGSQGWNKKKPLDIVMLEFCLSMTTTEFDIRGNTH